jgi:molybdate transport system ATP-binding protein
MDQTLNLRIGLNRGPQIDATFRVPLDPPSVTVIFGPSGGGKTTLLRVIAGLERPDHGSVLFSGEAWVDTTRGLHLPPQKRQTGFLFQDYALFPHLTVAQNIRFGLRKRPGKEAEALASELMERFHLADFGSRFPHQLSGGQKQRVALARSLAARPRLLLLDEPLSALDTPTRESLRGQLRQLLTHLGIPVLVVTHDRVEALALGDTLAVMDQGRILQYGPVEEVFRQPSSPKVAEIVGVETVLPATVREVADGMAALELDGGRLTALATALPEATQEVFVCIRAEDVVVLKGDLPGKASPRNLLPGVVKSLVREGPMHRLTLDCGFELAALLTRQACQELELKEGDRVSVLLKAPNVHLVPRSTRPVGGP